MEENYQRDVDAEVVLQVSQKKYQPTESDIDQDTVVSTCNRSRSWQQSQILWLQNITQIKVWTTRKHA